MKRSKALLRGTIQAAVALGGMLGLLVLGYALLVEVPSKTGVEPLTVVLLVGVGVVGLRVFGSIAGSLFGRYNVAEVGVKGSITRDGGGRLPSAPVGRGADDIVEMIETADDDRNTDGLLLRLNTPGGEVVPSDDIRLAVEEFDGPVVAYTKDVCASGGYWIASACDEIYARDVSVVGSIGVLGSRVNAKELADRLGVSYERFAAGKYKDAGTPLKEIEEYERDFIQGIIDDYYDAFVSRVAEGRSLSEDEIRDTEARYYLGDTAEEMGLVDEIGTRDDAKERLAELMDVERGVVREMEPRLHLRDRMRIGASKIAEGFGSGVASVIEDKEFDGFRFRLR
ncbi:MAG: signal peptide peptidase SppA [Halobacteria archaeon]|nr:signal peptide peptidase SppA [Halobacteria archaeon]